MSINDLSSDLYNGITTANFSAFGNSPDGRLLLIKKARGAANSSAPSFINVPGKLSGPAALLVFIFFKTFSTPDQRRFVPVKKNKIKRRNNDLKSAVNTFNKLVDSKPTKELVKYFKEENKKSRQHEKPHSKCREYGVTNDANPHPNNSSSAMPVNYNFVYRYPMIPPPNISQNTVTSRKKNTSNNNHRNSNSTGIFSYMDMLHEQYI